MMVALVTQSSFFLNRLLYVYIEFRSKGIEKKKDLFFIFFYFQPLGASLPLFTYNGKVGEKR